MGPEGDEDHRMLPSKRILRRIAAPGHWTKKELATGPLLLQGDQDCAVTADRVVVHMAPEEADLAEDVAVVVRRWFGLEPEWVPADAMERARLRLVSTQTSATK